MLLRAFLALVLALTALPALGAEVRLTVERKDVTVTGRSVSAITFNGQLPGPTLRFREGEDVTIHVTNKLDEDTSVHWHGLLLPGMMDGVPGLNGYPGIKPGETFTYRFKVRQAGTYWYHSHSGAQEQAGMYGALILDPRESEVVKTEREHIIVLSDFSEEDPDEILRNLKNDHSYYNRGRRTIGDFFRDARRNGLGATMRDRLEWGEMRMDPTDMADVSGYTFLVNGQSPTGNWTGLFRADERVRLRFINASAMSYFDVRIPGLKMIVVQADGQDVEPVPVDEFRIAVAETYDVVVTPREDKAYTIFAEPIDRSGYARATLAPREGMTADVPPMRPRTTLTMADMGMAHGGHGGHGAPAEPAQSQGHGGHGDHEAAPPVPAQSQAHGGHSDHDAPAAAREGPPRGWADAATPAGMRALKYSDLRSLTPQKDLREPTQEIVVRLGGSMERYVWTLNGAKAEHASPIELKYGERVKITFVNETMMAHPMHLHGMFVQLINGQPGERLPNKHIVSVAPGQSYSALLTADEPGEWAFHCHLLYHMAAGMMTKVVVARMSAEAK
ncbi:MAG: copper resistance system multicopper oxidase [Alphaproteobacteria bacterium]|nr:copper resistance system multicopper oxidase [Alphaproteobacteria bacterium]